MCAPIRVYSYTLSSASMRCYLIFTPYSVLYAVFVLFISFVFYSCFVGEAL